MNTNDSMMTYKRCGSMVACFGVAATALLGPVSPARADSVASYSLFAGHSIVGTGNITATGGAIGSNGDLLLAGATAPTIRGGGSLIDDFGAITTTGDVTVDGDAMFTFFGGVGGNLNAGHDANLTANVAGNIVAGGSVNTTGNTGGSIFSGGPTTTTGTVGGSIHQFSAVSPQSYATLPLPAAHTFTSGGTSFTLATFATETLLPGSYGDLLFAGSNTINLSAGNYYFDSIRSLGSFSTFNFDTTHGPVDIYVTGLVFLISPSMNLNGVSFNNIAPSNAGQVYWETHDNFSVEFAQVLGTVYAPNGDIEFRELSNATGSLVAGGDIIADGGTFNYGAPSSALLTPEPSGLVLGLGALACTFVLLRSARSRS